MLEIAWYWNQSLVDIKFIGASVAASTERHNVPVVITPVHLLHMSTDQITSAKLVTVSSRTSPSGFAAMGFRCLAYQNSCITDVSVCSAWCVRTDKIR